MEQYVPCLGASMHPKTQMQALSKSHIQSPLNVQGFASNVLNTVGDVPESLDDTTTMQISRPQNNPHPMSIHSYLKIIATVCDEVRAIDLQTDSHTPMRKQKSDFYPKEPRYLGSYSLNRSSCSHYLFRWMYFITTRSR